MMTTRPRLKALAMLLVWGTLGLAVHGVAATLDGLKPGGVPLGYALAALGAPVLMGLVLLFVCRARTRDPI
jgi:putative solute:sodium symporter small subunit